MAIEAHRQPHERGRAGFGAAVVLGHVLLGALLLSGLNVRIPRKIAESLTVISLRPEPVPDRKEPAPAPVRRTVEPAPRNLRAQPTEVVAPKPVVVPIPTPIVAAPVAGAGAASSAGASDLPGPGSGAGGLGQGGGRGGAGFGDGAPFVPSKRIAGKIRDSDYPDELRDAGIGGTSRVQFRVGTDGLVERCRVVESSGSEALDALTCRLITQRFRYRPARDEDGNPVPDVWFGENEWIPKG